MDRITRCIAAGLLTAAALVCAPAHAQVVVSQVYGGGGNSGATLRSDFIELRNNGAAAVALDGWSVQYASSSGSSWQVTALQGEIAAGGFYLVKQADGSGGSVDLPPPDAVGTIAMSGSNGKVALVQSSTALAGTCPLGGPVVDLVGYGSANCFEGSGATPGLSNTTAALRQGDGSVDTDDNASDFSRGEPDPRNSGSDEPPPPEPPVDLSIAELQGDGLLSAWVDRRVRTEGIVTARRFNNGFFLQSATGDGNPATSEAVFVFTGSAPPDAATPGNRVRVTGLVEEYVPAFNRNQLTITEIIDPQVELLATGQPLPAALELTAADLSPDAAPGTLERLEGMRVRVAEAVVVGPSGGSIDENDATASTDGVFHVVLPTVERPFREPGIGVLDRIDIPADKDPPRFDTNPERLMVRSWGQPGSTPLSVDVGAHVDGLVGVLDYHSATWALLPDADAPPSVSGGIAPVALDLPAHDEVTVGSFNLLRLFDEIADGNGAVTLTPEALDRRLAKTAAAVCDYLRAPDIIGVAEVENQRVLELLSARIDQACPQPPQYVAVLEPGNDVGAINVGFLVSTRSIGAGARVEIREVRQLGKDATLANPDGSTTVLNDRPPLLLDARVHHPGGAGYDLTVVVNHLRSLNDIDSSEPGSRGWPTTGDRVRAKRAAQAAYLAEIVASMQQADPERRIVLVGDFNAFEFNDGYVDVLGILRGDPAPPENVLLYADSPVQRQLLDGTAFIDDDAQHYSYVFGGNAQSLDHVLVNAAVVDGAAGIEVGHARINADFGVDNFGDPELAIRSSDHDPLRLDIRVGDFRSADLAVTAGASAAEAAPGDTVTFSVEVANAGPDAAAGTGVGLVFDAPVTPRLQVPDGWSCSAPAPDGDTTVANCSTASLAAGAQAIFVLELEMPAGVAELALSAAVQSQVADPANGNNQASVAVAASGGADLAVTFAAAGGKAHGAIRMLSVPVRNHGPLPASDAVLVLEGNLAPRLATVTAAADWTCDRAAATASGFRTECRRTTPMAPGVDAFGLLLVVPHPLLGPAQIEVAAEVTASTPDPVTGNNRAVWTGLARGR